MTDSRPGTGRCLCGKVELKASNASSHIGACHCSMCRRWGGGPFMEINCGSDISFSGEENISVFSSSDWAERGFCSSCGTHLFYRLKPTGEHMVPVGVFENLDGLEFKSQVFIDEKPTYYSFSNKTENKTGEELFSQFAPPED
ncbi:MAG: GFA family protein [Gammaproteobacteria bacterium]